MQYITIETLVAGLLGAATVYILSSLKVIRYK